MDGCGLFHYRVVTIGNPAVGKTSLVMRAVSDKFNADEAPTTGSCFLLHKVDVGDKMIRLQIWDTAGQEKFRALGPIYYRNADVGIVGFSLCDMDSAREVETWLKIFLESAGNDTLLYLVGTKKDAIPLTVNQESMRQIAEKHGMKFFTTSSLTGEGVAELFQEIAMDIQAKGAPPKSSEDALPSVSSVGELTKKRACC